MVPSPCQGHRRGQCRPCHPRDQATLQPLLIQGGVDPLCGTLPRLDGVPHHLRRHHPTLHGSVGSLDLGHVHETRTAANKAATREGELRDCLETALVQGSSSVADSLSALEQRRHAGVSLELLESLERVKVRVGVVETNDKAHSHQVVLVQVVEEGAAVCFDVRQRPAHCVVDSTWMMFSFLNPPQLLDADPIDLVLVVGVQVELLHQPLGQVAPAALTEDGALGLELHPPLKVVLGTPVLSNAHIVGGDSTYAAVFIVQHLCGGKARVDLNSKLLSLFSEPLDEVPHADDVVAMVVHRHAR